jgi:transcriptional regulator with XRE-family HTH domain
MNGENLKYQLGANIALYRKRMGLTQAELAEKLNYSDKAVSKWERGESVPDVLTLVQLAELFCVSVDDLLQDPNALPENTSKVEKVMEKAVEKTLKRKADKGIILNLSSLLVWFVALLAFVVLSSAGLPKSWISFFYAVPADAIVLLSLRSAWRDFRWNQTLVSVIVWGSLLSIYVTLLIFWNLNIWKLFLLGIPGQIAILLWFRMFRSPGREMQNG